MIQVKRIEGADLDIPKRATPEAAGYDLSAAARATLFPGDQQLISTGFAWAIPSGYVGIIKDRSGMASKSRIYTAAGVIDSDYRGEVKVLVRNGSDRVVKIEVGDRVAQMLVVPCVIDTVEEVAELSETARGAGGFGSTGA
ncbi:MAG: dUTP diphosphatase [Gammaproteobacteria bacterium]|nr:dUTP diphosphatase [Gammaproteobacteria bacterium]